MRILTNRRPRRYLHVGLLIVAAAVAIPYTTGHDECFDCGAARETSSWGGLDFVGEARETACSEWARPRLEGHDAHRWVCAHFETRWPYQWFEGPGSTDLGRYFALSASHGMMDGGRTFEQWFEQRRARTADVPDDELALRAAELTFWQDWFDEGDRIVRAHWAELGIASRANELPPYAPSTNPADG